MSKKSRARRKPQRSEHAASAPSRTQAAAALRTAAADVPLLALSLFGMALTAYLSWVALGSAAPAFCAAGSGCDVVQQSPWSRFLGVPVAVWGFLLYALLALVAWRPVARLARWRWAWRLSLAGLAISVYLTAVAALQLQAWCLWCLASLATMLAIFALVAVRRPPGAPGGPWPAWWLGSGLVALALVAAMHLNAGGLQRPEHPRLRALAEHLTESGAKYYGASWCGNCREQSRRFGASAARLPYVECSPNGRNGGVAFECVSARISGYPTWIIKGRHHVEVLTPEQLAGLSGFDWEGAAE